MELNQGEKWVYTHCAACYACCGLRVKVVDGVIVKIEGVEETDFGAKGGLCGKAVAAIMDFYDPNRCNYPMKRTNPKKGLFEDPKWQRISWDEALNTIAEKLKAAREKNPKRVAFGGTPSVGSAGALGITFSGFGVALGSMNFIPSGVGTHCGASSHMGAGLFHSSWSIIPDYKYCNYAVQFGSNKGTGSGHGAAAAMRLAAEARARGMKNIVFDPICNFSGGKATEWIPTLPAMDVAIILSMCNLIVNEIGVYDKDYIRDKTNGPYLVGPDKKFVRDKESGKPLLWDEGDGVAKTYDDSSLAHPAIDGEYTVQGVKCQPAFQLIKEHLKQYDPAWASELSTVPEHTIRRITKELVDESKIGATIEIEGVKLPYRPASVIMYKGGQGHQNGFNQYMSVMLINAFLGNQEAVGGTVSWPARSLGFPETGHPRYEPYLGEDGYPMPGIWYTKVPWPTDRPRIPQAVNLTDLFIHAPMTIYPFGDDFEEIWDKAGHPYDVDVVANYGGNMVKNGCHPETVAKWLSKVPFMFSISTTNNETTEGFADIVLPDTHFLESLDAFASITYFFNYPTGMDNWAFHLRQPVVPPQYERRHHVRILMDLAERLGIIEAYISFLENFITTSLGWWEVEKREGRAREKEVIVRPGEKISVEELNDRTLKYLFGQERGLEWFKEHGYVEWKKKPEEAYWRYFINVRVPIYFEMMIEDGEQVKAIAEKLGIHMDWDRYTPLISYAPSVIYTDEGPTPEFDMLAISNKDILHTGSFTAANPFIDECSQMNPYTYNVMINMETAKKKGLREGDIICLENYQGDIARGRLKLMKGLHPQVVACIGHMGSWARAKPVALGKGMNLNELIRVDEKHVCPITLAPECTIRVKVYKGGGK